MKIKKQIYFSILLTLVLFFVSASAFAAEFRVAGEKNGNVLISEAGIENLYTVGNVLSIESNIEKNVHAAGNVVTLNGDVGGSVYSGAGTLIVNGIVGGSVHGGGGNVVLNSIINDDVFIGGGNVLVSQASSIGEDLYIGAGAVDVQGTILGNVYIAGEAINLNSEIGGNVKIEGAERIVVASGTIINGNLEYRSGVEIEIAEGAVVRGEITRLSGKGFGGKGEKAGAIFGILSLIFLIKTLGLILVGLILVFLFLNMTQGVVIEGLDNFWKSLGIGLLFLIVIPIAIILLCISIIGIWLGIIVGMLYVLSLILSITIAGITFGSWVWSVFKKNKNYVVDWKIAVLGIIGLSLIFLVPVIGWLVFAVFMLISLGAIYRLAFRLKR